MTQNPRSTRPLSAALKAPRVVAAAKSKQTEVFDHCHIAANLTQRGRSQQTSPSPFHSRRHCECDCASDG